MICIPRHVMFDLHTIVEEARLTKDYVGALRHLVRIESDYYDYCWKRGIDTDPIHTLFLSIGHMLANWDDNARDQCSCKWYEAAHPLPEEITIERVEF